MATLVWTAAMRYSSSGDEAAFFAWLQSIPGVMHVEGRGRELFIRLKASRVSETALRELRALYRRYDGNVADLEVFNTVTNRAAWTKVFGPNPSLQRTAPPPLN